MLPLLRRFQSWRLTLPIVRLYSGAFWTSWLLRLKLGICWKRVLQPLSRSLSKEMELEHAFVKAGRTLLAGPDPTGIGGVVAGFGDQREIELLVEAGFAPVEAIHIAPLNGAQFLGEAEHIGTIASGKQADLVVIHVQFAGKSDFVSRFTGSVSFGRAPGRGSQSLRH